MSEARKPRLLVVDDEDDFRKLIAEALKIEGYAVTEARDGEEALKLSRQASFDLALLDIRMPKMDGISMIEAIKELNETKGYKIQVMCEIIGLPRSSYYKWLNRKEPEKEKLDHELSQIILAYYHDNNKILSIEELTTFIENKSKGDWIKCKVLSDGKIKEIDIRILE